jgi:putative ABC transport system substrate-binding protein
MAAVKPADKDVFTASSGTSSNSPVLHVIITHYHVMFLADESLRPENIFMVRFLVALMFGLLLLNLYPLSADTSKQVAITQIVEHPSLDAIRRGIIDALQDAGFSVGKNLQLDYQNAQGNPATAAQIARLFVGDAPDVIVAISTPSAQTVAAATQQIPVVFSAVSDPVGAKLISNRDHPGGNITGTSDLSPIAEQLDLIQEMMPKAKKLGVIYNPGEANSVSLVGLLKGLAPTRGYTVIESVATRSSEVLSAARNLVGKADVIYIPLDNTVVSALEAVIKVGIETKLPVYSADTDSVQRGAVASLGFNYYQVGRQTGRQVVRILNGEKPGNIPVEPVQKLNLFLNPQAAEAMGVTIPPSLVEKAAYIAAP